MRIKKVLLLFLFMFMVTTVGSCTPVESGSLETPNNFRIEDGVIKFDEVTGAFKYRIELKNIKTNEILKRFISQNEQLNELGIPEGDYEVRIQATNQNANVVSEFSEAVTYHQVDLDAVTEISSKALIDGNYIKWMGRTYFDEVKNSNTMYYSASGFEFKVRRTLGALECKAFITGTNTTNASKRPYIVLVLDNDFENSITLALSKQTTEVEIIGESGFIINDDEEHTIAVYKRSESIDSHISLEKLWTSGKFIPGVTYKQRKIEVIAASSSTGYGNLGPANGTKTTANSDALNAFAFLTAKALNSEINIVSASGWGVYASRWTTPNTLNMRDKYKYVDVFSNVLWDTSNYTPDVVVVNFGTNDYSYINMFSGADKTKHMDAFIANYVGFLNDLHHTYPNAKLVIIYGLMKESGIYQATEEIYQNAKVSIPDLEILKVEGDQAGCSAHPSLASHKMISEALIGKIKGMMEW